MACPREIRTGIDADGMPIIEKVAYGPSQEWMDMNGHVVRLKLSNGPLKADWRRDPYALWQISQKEEKGHLLYLECPMRNPRAVKWVPERLRDGEVCDVDQRARKPCHHMAAIQDLRRKRHEKNERAHNLKSRSDTAIIKEAYIRHELAEDAAKDAGDR
jgi:hypothetical protein